MPEPVLLLTADDPHGGPDGRTRVATDFSVNSNPFGPAPELLERLAHVLIHTYPDPTCTQEKRLAAAHHQADASHICFGSGSADLIHRLSRCYLNGSRSALVAAPTFGEYARAARLCGATVHHCTPYRGGVPDVAAVLEPLRRHAPTLVWLCQPNNPTGHAWRAEDLTALADACRQGDALLVLDLAYVDFLEPSTRQYPPYPHPPSALQLYSLTKSFRMPGVRLGYALAPAEVVNALEKSAPPWGVSAHAQEAARWAFSREGRGFLQRTLPRLRDIRQDFQKRLRALSFEVQSTQTNYFLLGASDAPAFKHAALRAGFRVRDAASFGLPTQVRLAAQQPQENQAFLDWLESDWLPEHRHKRG